MNFLVVDPHYPATGEVSDDFAADLRQRVHAEFGNEARVEAIDAGPSASIPAYIIDHVDSVADALAILSAPTVLSAGLKGWREWFDRAVSFFHGIGLPFAIDVPAAALLATAALFDAQKSTSEIEVISITRHWVNLGGPGSDHLRRDELGSPKDDLEKHFAAVTQLNAHYVILLAQELRCFTALVSQDGNVIHVEELGA